MKWWRLKNIIWVNFNISRQGFHQVFQLEPVYSSDINELFRKKRFEFLFLAQFWVNTILRESLGAVQKRPKQFSVTGTIDGLVLSTSNLFSDNDLNLRVPKGSSDCHFLFASEKFLLNGVHSWKRPKSFLKTSLRSEANAVNPSNPIYTFISSY